MQHVARLQLDDATLRAEDICLASEEFVIDSRPRGARTGPTLAVGHRVRRCRTELALLDGHRLAVRSHGPRRLDRRYVIDLRFLDDTPLMRRTIAWNCWLACLASAAVAGLVAWLASSLHAHPEVASAWMVVAGFIALGLLLGAAALYRTHETLVFHSVHGRVALAELSGGLGCARAAMSFRAALAQRIAAARADVPQSRQQYLRDELREHRRLFESGVLAGDAYEAGKRRILQAHD
ncbi:MAG TPA: hypothetical protein VFP48_08040 [Steroidobacteraceae bacterium]|nr:hypothetical protein [Steroidobacteraceae bacterium]